MCRQHRGWHSEALLFAFNTNCTVFFSIHVCLATGHNMKDSLQIMTFKGLSEVKAEFLHLFCCLPKVVCVVFGMGEGKYFAKNELQRCFKPS